jgi:hypothetical protein
MVTHQLSALLVVFAACGTASHERVSHVPVDVVDPVETDELRSELATAGYVPGGVADPSLSTLYLNAPEAGLRAIDVATGDERWSVEDAISPLVATADLVYALSIDDADASSARLVALSRTDDGRAVWRSDVIELPQGAYFTSYANDSCNTWRAGRVELAERQFGFSWVATHHYCGGAPPPPEMLHGVTTVGRVHVDLGTGRVTAESESDVDVASLPVWSQSSIDDVPNAVSALSTVRYEVHDPLVGVRETTQPWAIGDQLGALDTDTTTDPPTLQLRAWQGQSHTPVDASALSAHARYGNLKDTWPTVARLLPGGVLMVTERTPVADTWTYTETWKFFSALTGQPLGSMSPPADGSFREVVVRGGHLYALVHGDRSQAWASEANRYPRAIVAIDLASGERVWERQIIGQPMPQMRP